MCKWVLMLKAEQVLCEKTLERLFALVAHEDVGLFIINHVLQMRDKRNRHLNG